MNSEYKTPGSFFLIVLVILTLFSIKSFGFNLTDDFKEGFFWQNLPINLSVVDDQSFEVERISNLEWALEQAIAQWSLEAPQLEFWRADASVAPNTTGVNIVKWDRDFALSTGLQGNQYLAVTVRRAVIPFIAQVEILMNAYYVNLPKNDLVKILIHELGHTIGLDHSEDPSSIMSAAIRLGPYSNQSIQTDDMAGLSYIHTEMGSRQAGTSSDPAYWELRKTQEQNSSTALPSCGTIEDINKHGGGGSGSFLISFVFGLLLAFCFGKNFHLGLIKIID